MRPRPAFCVLLMLGGCAGLAGLDDYAATGGGTAPTGAGGSGAGGSGAGGSGTAGSGAGGAAGGSSVGGAGGSVVDCTAWQGSFTSRYHCEVMVDAPTSYWRLGESDTASTYVDLGSNDFDGSQVGSLTQVPGLIDDAVDGATRFDGGHINIQDRYDFDGRDLYTVELWVRAVTQQPANNMVLVQKMGPGMPTGDVGWRLFMDDGDGDLVSIRNTDGPDAYANSNLAAATSGATYFVATYDGNNLRVFVNGSLEDTIGHVEPLPDTNGDLLIGDNSFNLGTFDGILDELAIYDEVLADERITAHFDAGRGVLP